jgi:hypothetical protein
LENNLNSNSVIKPSSINEKKGKQIKPPNDAPQIPSIEFNISQNLINARANLSKKKKKLVKKNDVDESVISMAESVVINPVSLGDIENFGSSPE